MNDIITMLEILIDTTKEKKVILLLIKQMTDKQSGLFKSKGYDESLFINLIKMKQTKIDLVKGLDQGFEATYDRVKTVLGAQPKMYAKYINELQGLIVEVGELSVSIQVEEMRNKRLLDMEQSRSKAPKLEVDVKPSKQLSKNRIDAYTSYKKGKVGQEEKE